MSNFAVHHHELSSIRQTVHVLGQQWSQRKMWAFKCASEKISVHCMLQSLMPTNVRHSREHPRMQTKWQCCGRQEWQKLRYLHQPDRPPTHMRIRRAHHFPICHSDIVRVVAGKKTLTVHNHPMSHPHVRSSGTSCMQIRNHSCILDQVHPQKVRQQKLWSEAAWNSHTVDPSSQCFEEACWGRRNRKSICWQETQKRVFWRSPLRVRKEKRAMAGVTRRNFISS